MKINNSDTLTKTIIIVKFYPGEFAEERASRIERVRDENPGVAIYAEVLERDINGGDINLVSYRKL